MDEVTQQNAALAEQTSAAAASMSEKAREMHQMMNFFTVSITNSKKDTAVKNASIERAKSKQHSETIEKEHYQKKSQTDKKMTKITEVKKQNDHGDEWEEF